MLSGVHGLSPGFKWIDGGRNGQLTSSSEWVEGTSPLVTMFTDSSGVDRSLAPSTAGGMGRLQDLVAAGPPPVGSRR